MTTNTAARNNASPRFHVGSSASALRSLLVTALCLALAIGFIAQILSGSAPRSGRDLQTDLPGAAATRPLA